MFPDCASLSMPLNGGSNVSISTDLSWGNVDGVIGYKLTVGTTSGGTDILNSMDVGNVTTYDPGNFPYSTTIYVTITPYDGNGDAQGCTEESFTTEAAPIPGCTDPTAHNYNPAANQDDGSCETCSDGIQNGDETGVDCGGLLCGPCPVDPPSITAFTEGAILDNGCSNEGRPEEGITIPLAWTAVEGADLYNVVLTVTGASVPLLNSNTVLTSSVYECTACLTNAASVGVKVRARVNGIWTAFSPTVTGYFEPVNTDCPDCVPTVGCSNITAELGPDGHLFLTPGMIDDGTSEACGTGMLSLDQEYFNCDDLGIQAVTLVHAMRDVVVNGRAEQLQAVPENRRRGDSIDVVVAINRDSPLRFDGGNDAVGRRCDAR